MLVLVDEMEPLLQRAGLETWVVRMPFSITTPPIDPPDVTAAHIAGFGHRTLDPLRLIAEVRPLLENLDLIPFDALPLPDHVPEVKGRTTMSPDDPLDLLREGCDFVLCEGHGFIKSAFRDSVKIFSPHSLSTHRNPACDPASRIGSFLPTSPRRLDLAWIFPHEENLQADPNQHSL